MTSKDKREPVLGQNAKNFAIQFAIGLAVLFTVAPIFGRIVADSGCQFMGLCLPEAAEPHGGESPPMPAE